MNKKLRSEIIRKCEAELVVPMVEGLYCDEWLWFPEIHAAELEAWWCALENVETFWSAAGRSNWPGAFIRIDEDAQLLELWESLWSTGAYRVRVEFNEQPDFSCPESYLRKADGTVFLHQGAFTSRVAERTQTDES